jgi:hypothetical protein
VPLADLPQADRHPQLARFEVALVGVRDHGRVAQRRRLDRELVAEVRADQRARGGRQRDVGRHPVADHVVVVGEHAEQVVVAAGEPGLHVVEQPDRLVLVQPQDALDQPGRAVLHQLRVLAGHEQLDHHAPRVRLHHQRMPVRQLVRTHGIRLGLVGLGLGVVHRCGHADPPPGGRVARFARRRACCSVATRASVDSAP